MQNISRFIKLKVVQLIGLLSIIGVLIQVITDIDKTLSFLNEINPFVKENQDISKNINLDMDINKVNQILGMPNENDGLVFSYFTHGIQIAPDYEFQDKVGGIVVTQLKSGVSYKGYIKGIKLDNTFEEIQSVLGSPIYWGISSELTSTAIWKTENNAVVIVDFTKIKDWKANKITYSKQSSKVSYLAIVNSAIQELKAGRISVFFNELSKMSNNEIKDLKLPIISLESFKNNFLNEDYKVIGSVWNPMGGMNIILGYETDILEFWVYPLDWKQPSIRAIISIKESQKFKQNINFFSSNKK